MSDPNKPVLLSEKRVAERYDVSTRTLIRWDETPELQFPPPILINRRRYREMAKLEKWEKLNAQRAAQREGVRCSPSAPKPSRRAPS